MEVLRGIQVIFALTLSCPFYFVLWVGGVITRAAFEGARAGWKVAE